MHRVSTPLCAFAALIACSSPHALAQSQTQRLTPTGALTSDIFSYDTAFDGQVMVMGAPFATYSGVSQPGRAFIFEKPGATWVQTAKLQPPVLQEGAAFGTQVACGSGPSGQIVVIGCSGEDGPLENSGAAYVFEKLGPTWTLIQRLTAPTPEFHGNFGVGLSVSSGVIAVGSNGATDGDFEFAGHVFLYEKVAGLWTLTATLSSPDPAAGDGFGTQVALDHDRILVGTPFDDSPDADGAGAIHSFVKSGGSWVFDGKLTALTPEPGKNFGSSLALRGSLAACGYDLSSPESLDKAGEAYVYRLQGAAWSAPQVLKSPLPDPGDHFGTDVAIDGRTLLVGAYLQSVSGRTGAAHVFREHAGLWQLDTTLTASDTGGTLFGWRLGLAGDTACIGGPFYQTNRGAAYVFTSMRSCSADIDGSGFVDTDDFDTFVHAYEQGAQYADMDGSGFVDTDDFDKFVAAYEAGC